MIMDRIALALAIIGGLNWGSIGIFGFDIVGSTPLWASAPSGVSPFSSGRGTPWKSEAEKSPPGVTPGGDFRFGIVKPSIPWYNKENLPFSKGT